MKNSKKLILIIVLLLAVALAAAFIFTKNSNKATADADNDATESEEEVTLDEEIDQEIENLAIEEEGNDFDNPEYANEQEGAVVNEKAAAESDFIGKWSANSNHAHYLYGNIDLEIKEGGKWSGNITEDDYEGTWTYNDKYITLESKLVNCDLFFAEDGQLMFRDHSFPEDLVVLSKN